MAASSGDLSPPYVKTRENFQVKYTAGCFCGSVKFEIAEDPVDASYCHCRGCQRLHGAPYQWAVILHKDAVFFPDGTNGLAFYNSSELSNEHKLPCKVLCSTCHSPLADEGRNMMLVFPVAIHFEGGRTPESFKAYVNDSCPLRSGPSLKIFTYYKTPESHRTHHMFYGSRIQDMTDGLPKFLGKKGSPIVTDQSI